VLRRREIVNREWTLMDANGNPESRRKAAPTIMSKPVILITGASQGIGAAIAKVFAKELPGCRLALVAPVRVLAPQLSVPFHPRRFFVFRSSS